MFKILAVHPSGSSMTDNPLGALGVNFDCRTTLFMEQVVAFQVLVEKYKNAMTASGWKYPENEELMSWKKDILCAKCRELKRLAKKEITPRFKKNGKIIEAEGRFFAAIREYHALLRTEPENEKLYRQMTSLAREKADALQRILIALIEKEKLCQDSRAVFQYASYIRLQFPTNEHRKGKGRGIRVYKTSAEMKKKIKELEKEMEGLLKTVYLEGCPPMMNILGIDWGEIVKAAENEKVRKCEPMKIVV